MISELQIGNQRLLAPIHNILRDKLGALVIDPFTLGGQEVWVEQLEVLDPPVISFVRNKQANIIVRSNVSRETYAQADTLAQNIRITQDIHVNLSSRVGAVFTPVAKRTARVFIQVSAALVEGQGVALNYGLENDPVALIGANDPELLQFLGTQLDAVKPSTSIIPFDTFFLPNIDYRDDVNIGGHEKQRLLIVNAGIALSADGTFLSLRVEVPGFPNTVAPWTSFFEGLSANHLDLEGSHGFVPAAGPAPWSLFFDRDAFRYSISESMTSALVDADVFDITPSVSVDWSAPGGGSRIAVRVVGRKNVAGGDVFVTITLTLDLSVPETNEIQLDASFDGEVEIAGIDVGFLIKLLADVMLDQLVGSTFSASDVLGSDSPLGAFGKDLQCVATSLTSLHCRGLMTIPAVLGNLRDSLGFDEGLLLMGGGAATISLLDPRPVLDATPFLWIAEIGCPTPEFTARAGKEPIFSVLVANGAIHVSNPVRGARLLQINRVRILDDFTGMYSESHTGSANDFLVGARCGYPPLPFFHRPFPFIAAIYTNAGVKLARLEAPPALTDDAVKKIVSDAVTAAIPDCFHLISPWGGSFNPKWNVDPSPELGEQSYVQIWELEVPASAQGGVLIVNAGTNAAEVRILGSAGRPLSASFATRRREGLQLQFRESAAPKWRRAAAATAEPDRLGMVQTLLCKAAHLSLGHTLKSILLVEGDSGPLLAVGLRSEVTVYDLSAPSDPKEIFALPVDGVVGLAEGRTGQVLAWGHFGIVAIDRRGSDFAATVVMNSPVETGCLLGGRWYLSTIDGIVVLDCELERERCIRRPGGYCGCLVSVGRDLLWVAGGEAFRLSSCSSRWIPVVSESAGLPYRFESVHVGRTPYLFAEYERQGGSLWTLRSGRLAMECEFAEDPWFRRSARMAEVFATADRSGGVSLYGVAGKANSRVFAGAGAPTEGDLKYVGIVRA